MDAIWTSTWDSEIINLIKFFMQTSYKKAIIFLNGVNCKINTPEVLDTIKYSLNCLKIPYEIYKEHRNGFRVLKDDMNQDGVLYILNDSAAYHLCKKPNILMTRCPVWVQSTAKPNTIGVFTRELLLGHGAEFIACIARNTPVAQPYDLRAPQNYILVNDYESDDLDAIARNGLAAISWRILAAKDIHAKVLLQKSDDPGLPKVNNILEEGIRMMDHPDDILIFINRDICLIPEATTIIRNYMENYGIDAVSARRVDVEEYKMHSFDELQKKQPFAGIDLFAFKTNSPILKNIVPVDLYIGKYFWDTYWNVMINHELPYNIIYHILHDSEWKEDLSNEYNVHNNQTVHRHLASVAFNYNNSRRI